MYHIQLIAAHAKDTKLFDTTKTASIAQFISRTKLSRYTNTAQFIVLTYFQIGWYATFPPSHHTFNILTLQHFIFEQVSSQLKFSLVYFIQELLIRLEHNSLRCKMKFINRT